MSNLKKDIDEILNTLYEDILVSESELADGDRKTSLEIVEQALKQATTQIINLIESVIPKSKNLAYRQGRQLPVLTGIEAKDLNHVKVKKYINFGYNQAIKDIKNKLIGGTK